MSNSNSEDKVSQQIAARASMVGRVNYVAGCMLKLWSTVPVKAASEDIFDDSQAKELRKRARDVNTTSGWSVDDATTTMDVQLSDQRLGLHLTPHEFQQAVATAFQWRRTGTFARWQPNLAHPVERAIEETAWGYPETVTITSCERVPRGGYAIEFDDGSSVTIPNVESPIRVDKAVTLYFSNPGVGVVQAIQVGTRPIEPIWPTESE